MDINKLYKELNSSPNGLKCCELLQKEKKYGKNILSKKPQKSFIKRVFIALMEPMVRLLIFAIFLTILINILKILRGDEGDWQETVGVTLSVLLATSITVFMETRSQKAFDALTEIGAKIKIKVLRDNNIMEVWCEDIYPGDIIFISNGDKVPADGKIIEATELAIDEAPLTGESNLIKKDIGDDIFTGTFVQYGNGKFIVTATGDNTEIGTISQAVQKDYENITPLQKELATLGRRIAWVGTGIAIIVFFLKIFNHYIQQDLNMEIFAESLTLCLVLIVSTIPEGLSTMVAAALALAVLKLSKANALVKKLTSCEAIGSIDLICSDKTGTLTENKMTVVDEYILDSHFALWNIKINNNSHLEADLEGNKYYAGNPTEIALLEKVKTFPDVTDFQIICQFPFSSEKKSMGTLINFNHEKIFFIKGAPEKILSLSILTEEEDSIKGKIETYQKAGKRVIAFAHKIISSQEAWNFSSDFLEKNLEFDGFMVISDPLRKEAYSAVKKCFEAGIDIKMLTGDNLLTAQTIAKELGLTTKNKNTSMESSQIDKLDDKSLEKELHDLVVIARSKPMTKFRIVDLLMKQNKSVAVTGDGINDAPSLKRAEVGIAMGISGTEVAKEAADIILLDDSFATIVKAIETGRGLYENFQKFIQFQQTVNVAALFIVLIYELMGWDAPLTPVQILWINIMMDGPLAVSLSCEPTRKNIMKEKPRDKNKSIITPSIFGNIMGTAFFMVVYAIFIIRFLRISTKFISTYIFNLLVFMIIFNVFNCKEIKIKSIFSRIFDNKFLNWVFLAMFLLQIFMTTVLKKILNVYLLSLSEYFKIIILSFAIIPFNELIKFIRRRFERKKEED
jgi:Ca2+-transporting ATPase